MRVFLGLLLTLGIAVAFGCGDDDDDGAAGSSGAAGGVGGADAGGAGVGGADAGGAGAGGADAGGQGSAGEDSAVDSGPGEVDEDTGVDSVPAEVEEEIIDMLEGTWLAKTTAESAFEVFQIYHFTGNPLRATLDWIPNPDTGWCRLEPSEFDSLRIEEIDSSNSFKIVFRANTDTCGVNPENEGGINVMDLEAKTAEMVTTIGIVMPATFEKCSDDYDAEDACGTQSDLGPPPGG